MAPSDRALFLSLKPRYADLILDGEKTVELRRIRPRAETGTLVVVYACTPVRAVLGTCIVEGIRTTTPTEIWDLHGPWTCVGRQEFDAYFRGRSVASAITVGQALRLASPVSLDHLRRDLDRFTPPQSFRYLTAAEVRSFLPAASSACAPVTNCGAA